MLSEKLPMPAEIPSALDSPTSDVVRIAAAVEQAVQQQQLLPLQPPKLPPPPLPPGWVLRQSRSLPNTYFYFNMETGESSWTAPVMIAVEPQPPAVVELDEDLQIPSGRPTKEPQDVAATKNSEHHHEDDSTTTSQTTATTTSAKKRTRKHDDSTKSDEKSSSSKRHAMSDAQPTQIRVLHILRKHKDARRPSSWRNEYITISKDEARQEMQALLDVLQEVAHDSAELKATFQELARTESDCSSHKRGGDLGYFGRGKMQAPFEKASFGLQVGQLSNLVESPSGVHLILRLA